MLNGSCGSIVNAAALVDTPLIPGARPDREQI